MGFGGCGDEANWSERGGPETEVDESGVKLSSLRPTNQRRGIKGWARTQGKAN